MSFDLTNKNIQDTFQNLLQRTGSDNRLFDLTGNEIGDLRISGSLTAQQYIVSSSVTNITTQELSGSTIFGDSSDDTHLFTGNITSSGDISSSGTINASEVLRNGTSVTTNILTSATQGQFGQVKGGAQGTVLLTDLGTTGNPKFNHITASGNISGSGGDILGFNSASFNYITASIIDVDGDTIRFGGEPFTKANIQTLKLGRSLKPLGLGKSKPDVEGDDAIFDGNLTVTHITASGDIRNTQTLQMTNSSSIVNTFGTGSIRSSKYVLQVTSASNYQVSEMLVLHNDGTTLNTEYAQLNSGVNLVDFSTKVVNQNVQLIASSSFISCSVKYERTIIPT